MPAIRPSFRLRPSGKGQRVFAPATPVHDRLNDFPIAGDNPGNLLARIYVPKGLSGPAPLVVVLHGCTQNAAVYDHGSGWSRLADREGFIVLFPEQQRANNPMLCFNWFTAGDTQRDMGEAASIRAMIESVTETHEVDPDRIYVTGLSAGGAMTSVMLATYPEVFAGGAIIAGVAYGCASGVAQAFDCMGGRAPSDAKTLGQKVRQASPHQGPWPRVQIWQGTQDPTVVPSNADAIALQWANLHSVGPKPDQIDEVSGYPRRLWTGADGKPVIEQYNITGMAHGIPLDPGTDDHELGAAGAHMLDVGLSSTGHIAAFFGIAPLPGEGKGKTTPATKPAAKATKIAEPDPTLRDTGTSPMGQPEEKSVPGVQSVIENALRAAGLMK